MPNPEWTGERGREPMPLKGYSVLIGAFGATVSGILGYAAGHDDLLDEISLTDIAILGVGSHKLARMATRDRIGTVLRQPFTEYRGTSSALPGEATEDARRDDGELRQAIGELLVCPYCMSTWAAVALFGTYLADRKLGRTAGAFLSVVGIAEMMQSVYRRVVGGS